MASGYNSHSYTAAEAIAPFRVVYVSGANEVSVNDNDTDFPVGVSGGGTSRFDDSDTNSGDPIELQETGVKRIQASAAISAGAVVAVTTGGKVVTAPAAAAGNKAVGVAITAASDADDLILVHWWPHARNA